MASTEDNIQDETYEVTGSGASKTYPIQCSALRKNGHVMLKGHPCKIVDMSTSKTGKHGHAKVNLTGTDIFTSKRYEDICPSTHNMEVPLVKRTEYTLADIDDDGFCTLMLDDGTTKEDLKLPEDGGDDIRTKFNEVEDGALMITVLGAMDQEKIVQVKKANQ